MKLDKETLIKQRFWILLGTAAVLTLIGWLWLWITVPAAVGKAQTAVESKWHNYKKHDKFKAKEWVALAQQEATELKSELTKVNLELYKAQDQEASVMTWPTGMKEYDFRNGLYANTITIHPPATPGKKDKNKADVLKSLPADSPKQMTGFLISADAEYFTVEDAKGAKHRFFRTPRIKITDNKDPKLVFGRLSEKVSQPVTVTYVKGKYFGEEFTPAEIRAYCDAYKNQLAEVLAALGPVNELNEPVVQMRYTGMSIPGETANECWIYDKSRLPPADNRFFNYVEKWDSDVKNVSSDEVWAAQENLWVQRELYKQLKAANDSLAAFELVKSDKDGKSATFKNFYWQINLTVTSKGVEAQLKNLRPYRQSVDGLRFLLRFTDPDDKNGSPSEPVLFPPKGSSFKGEAVGPAGGGNDVFPAKESKFFPLAGVTLTTLHSVEQVLTVDTAAVKRLDVVTLAAAPGNGEQAVDHRQGLKKYVAFSKKIGAAPPPVPVKRIDPDTGEEVVAAPREVFRGDIVKSFTVNGLLLERYLEVTSTNTRRLPICLVAVVSPDQFARVQAALVSSPLRFLETQVFMQRALLTSGRTAVAGAPVVGGAKKSDATGGIGEGQENIELTIYAVVTLYDRPDRPMP